MGKKKIIMGNPDSASLLYQPENADNFIRLLTGIILPAMRFLCWRWKQDIWAAVFYVLKICAAGRKKI